ncbi:signal recognition particle-docking protein FtsY [Lactiplantibacillus plantarum]|uniref:signal recognition particle-docking protein FtsY n=1 Tax=Lactiplantibacillus plantarum TaxID=1590 RepID=UPI00204174E7|nr:signal recognition particle-docking protein FtsY [Lactiplantibacillus plantarum]MCM2584758.1 signal recognition particle-docking protein FtsY [Lactiplantibacillus plantarum]MCM2598684.1 signal recognition particle-docking protein FtsY [Lactiplantibacillus plantarum]MCM2601847.1 signal recognition particle-docking protein FtsY [Lactiplantibacillus plantarum]MCM2609185.1 signal recognition particle-docking protein FtsY [Lactiplantibacillus plantarum]MCM2611001.1 signal recognition particle-do
MGLFSRLKKAFSLPESDDAQTTSAASEAPATTSQANAPVSDDRAPSSQQLARSEGATTESTATPVSSTAVSEATSTADEPATVKSAATSEAPADSTAAVSAQSGSQAPMQSATVSEAPLTASAMVAQSLAALSASAAQVSQAAASDVALATKSDAVVEGNAMSESVASTAPAVKSSVPTATESAAPTVNAAADSESAEPEPTEAERYDEGLKKSRKTFGDRINAFLANFRHVDEAFFDDLEDTLIESDVGYETAMRISDELRDEVKLKNAKSKKEISSVIVEKLVDMYGEAGEGEDNSIHMAKSGPTVILFVGVNGAGKTTTIGKMANMYKQQGKKVLLAACDTFRAGAIQQLQVWGQRDGVDVVAKAEKSDPAAVCFDAVKKAKAEDYDVLFVDTAGRLQNKVNLMNELEKIKRVITREIPDAPHEVLLVLDATTGQNALNQAKLFKQSTDVSGIVLTKLDGTARGGIVLAIRNELHLAVKYVGLGEKVTDLRPFNANDFVYGLFKDIITG